MDRDHIAEGSRLGKSAIEADTGADYKQAYMLYEECLKAYIEGLRTEDQEDRIEWTHEQILIRFERLAELHAWYKRKNLLEPNWLELGDLLQRLEIAAPPISAKLHELSTSSNPQSPPPTQPSTQSAGGVSMVASLSNATNSTIQSGQSPAAGVTPTPFSPIQSPGAPPQPPQQPGLDQQQQRPSVASLQYGSSPDSAQPGSAGFATGGVNGAQHPVMQLESNPNSPPLNGPGGYPPPAGSTGDQNFPNGLSAAQTFTNQQQQQQQQQQRPNGSPAQQYSAQPPPPGQPLQRQDTLQYQQEQGYQQQQPPQNYPSPSNQYQSPQAPQQQYPPAQQQSPQNTQPPYNQPPTQYIPPQQQQQQPQQGQYPGGPGQQQLTPIQTGPRTEHLLTPTLALSLPTKTYHCYGAAQKYRGGAEGWNIEIKDATKNPIYYLYGLKQASAPLTDMSLHREDGKKTRCMDIFSPHRNSPQYNVGDMTYKHYLPVPLDIVSRGDPNSPIKRRVFTFNGRRFLWRSDGQSGNSSNETLFEIDDGPQGANPNQAGAGGIMGNGRPLETRLAWYEHTMARKKLGRVVVVGGLDLQTEEVFLGTCLGNLCLGWESSRGGK